MIFPENPIPPFVKRYIAFPVAAFILAGNSPEPIMAVIESPCIKVCIIQASNGLCLGCGRNVSEISAWSSLSREARIRLMADLPRRLAAPPPSQAAPSSSS